jgi:membrane protease YdiL (CAAX protease family)
MTAILSIWWLYFAKARGAPRSTQFARKVAGRANRLSDDLWGPALGTGVLGLFTTLLLQGVLARLVTLPQQRDLDPSKYSVLTMLAWVVMSALVAGVVEETAFRGYIQGGIERSHGLTTAILVTGALFGFSHFAHPEVGIVLLPFYLAAATVYGLLAAATDSVYPSMVLHAGGNMLSAFDLVSRGRSEWQLTAAPPPTIWQAGADASFWANLAALLVFGAATVFAYRALFKAARTSRLEQTSLL